MFSRFDVLALAQSEPCRVPGCFRARGDSELAVDALDVARDRVLGELQRLGDLTIAQALSDHGQNLTLARREAVIRGDGAGPAEMLHDPPGHRRRKRRNTL